VGVISGYPKKPFWGFAVLTAGALCWMVFTYSQFMSGRIMWEVVRPTLSMALAQLGVFSYTFLVMDKDKRFLKNTFGTYISPKLIDQMIEEKTEPQLGGVEAIHTAFFTDIQSFSGFSEKLTPSELVELLNDYLTEMTDILLENKGTLDKYIGDAIVAFYGAPSPVNNHEYWACLTAIKMQDRLAELREKWQGEGERWPEIVHHMQNRIGINTGPMVTGNMGSATRMNYTMMGDTVNLAARLEASAKQYGVYIQVADESHKACKDKFIWRDLDFVIVMGKTEPAQVFELIAEIGNMPPGYDKLLPAYDEALELYKNQEWAKAIDAFKASNELENMFPGRKTNPSRIYIPRCEHYKNNNPGDDWDGVWTLTSK
jgi:adenylate cyclase